MRKLVLLAMAVMVGWVLLCSWAGATWKPEYGVAPYEVQQWFSDAKLMPGAAKRLGYTYCCNHAERFKTNFKVVRDGSKYGTEQWLYEKDGQWVPIPGDIIHNDSLPVGKTPEAQVVFAQMRVEGVLMIYEEKPFCFWPPESGQ